MYKFIRHVILVLVLILILSLILSLILILILSPIHQMTIRCNWHKCVVCY